MTISRSEALRSARKLLRTFAGAPEPRRQARAIYSALAHGDGWSAAEAVQIKALGELLDGLPPVVTLRSHCEAAIIKLET